MSNEKDTVDYTVRGFSRSFDRTLTDLSILWNKPKSVILREIAEEHLTDRIKTFGMLSKLVSALDEVVAGHVGAVVSDHQVENHFGTRWNMEMCELLNIRSDEELQRIVVDNTRYLTVRADQVLKGYKWIPKGTALWFALFAEVAVSSPDIVRQAWEKIFYSVSGDAYYRYYANVNELRRLHHLDEISADARDFERDGEFCQVAVTKPAHYQYGAWRVDILLSEKAAQLPPACLRFPTLPHRIFLADKDGLYTCQALFDEKGSELGFQFVAGECKFDVYSDGQFEDFNPTAMTAVAGAIANTVDEYVRNNLKD